MAEYWKSQPKHHCDFCDCWIADNKPSRDYHEKGKKHQQNVQAKISKIHKKTRDDAKKKAEMNSYLKEMEQRALAAAKKDLQVNPSLAALYGVKPKEFGPENRPEQQNNPEQPRRQEERQGREEKRPGKEEVTNAKEEQDVTAQQDTDYNGPEYWDEDKSPEGHTYYWNTVTGESRWVPPEGYKPKAERSTDTEAGADTNLDAQSSDDASEETRTAKTTEEENETPRGTKRKLDEQNSEEEEQLPVGTMEDVSAIPLPGSIPETPADPEPDLEPKPRPERQINSAYAQWKTAKEPEPQQQVDLQLPSSNTVEEKMLTVYAEPKIKFREKTVPSLKDSLPAVFKKKKKGIGFRNLKPRTDDL